MTRPTKTLKKHSHINRPKSSNGVYHSREVYLLITISVMDVNRIIETASLTIPSPKTKLNSLGYLSELIKVKAATESVAHIVDEYNKI